MTHQIKLEELHAWLENDTKVVYAHDTKDKKYLYVTSKGNFEVHKNGVVVWQGRKSFLAVQEYNKI